MRVDGCRDEKSHYFLVRIAGGRCRCDNNMRIGDDNIPRSRIRSHFGSSCLGSSCLGSFAPKPALVRPHTTFRVASSRLVLPERRHGSHRPTACEGRGTPSIRRAAGLPPDCPRGPGQGRQPARLAPPTQATQDASIVGSATPWGSRTRWIPRTSRRGGLRESDSIL